MLKRTLVALVGTTILAGCASRSVAPNPAVAPAASGTAPTLENAIVGWNTISLSSPVTNYYAFALGHDGDIYTFSGTPFEPSSIARIDLKGDVAFSPISGVPWGSLPVMTPNPDGNVYALEQMPDASYDLVRVSQTGSVTEIPLAVPDAPGALITGSDQNLWLLHGGGIARVTTNGVYTEFGGGPVSNGELARGPDKNVWARIQNESANEFMRVSVVDGSETTFPAPADASELTRGPDGNLYCVGLKTDQMYALNVADGTFVSYSLSPAPTGDTMVADNGRLWWENRKKVKVFGWNVKTHKIETRIVAPVFGTPFVASDKNIWFFYSSTQVQVLQFN